MSEEYIYPSIYLSIHLFSVYLFIYLSVFCISISIHPSVYIILSYPILSYPILSIYSYLSYLFFSYLIYLILSLYVYIYIFIYLFIYTEREREKKAGILANCAHSIHVCPSRPKSHPQCNLTVRQVPPFSFHGLRK